MATLHAYLETEKGAHDAKDYGKAALLILLTCMAAAALVIFLTAGGRLGE